MDRQTAEEITKLRAEIECLRSLVLTGKKVDLVNFGALKVFMYMDDLAYQQVQPMYKNCVPSMQVFQAKQRESLIAEEVYQDNGTPVAELLIAHHWIHGLQFSYIDVGCQYGSSAIKIADFILRCGKRNRVIAFEPGVAGDLVPYNSSINNVQEVLVTERMAVADGSYPTILLTELGHSENNRVVNRTPEVEAVSYVVSATSIDDYIERMGIEGNLIIKIDTQGAEVEVFRGLERTAASRAVTCMTEYTPWALATRVDPAEWLRGFLADFYVLDMGDSSALRRGSSKLAVITPNDCDELVKSLENTRSKYTDLLFIPKKLTAAQDIIARLI